MPSASTSTLSSPSSSRSSLSHWMTVRSGIAAFSIGTSSSSSPSRDDEAADVLREVARKAEQSSLRERQQLLRPRGLSGSKPASRKRSAIAARRPTTAWRSASRSTCLELEAERLADVAQRAPRPVA